MGSRRVVGVLGVAAVLLLSGCGADASSGSRAMSADARAGAPAAAGAPGSAAKAPQTAASGGAGSVSAPAADPKYIAYTAQLAVEVPNVPRAAGQARSLVVAAGGYVAGEAVTGGAKGEGDARLTLKVPSAGHQQALDQLSALGRQLSLTSQADDVTQQVVDVDSRLKTQQASVDRVRALMAQAQSLQDVVSLEGELSRREADLESLQRQQRELAGRTSLSTITLELQTDQQAPAASGKHDGFWGSIGGALAGGWHVLGAVVRGVLVGLAAAMPFLLVLAPVGWLLWRRRKRRAGKDVLPEAASE